MGAPLETQDAQSNAYFWHLHFLKMFVFYLLLSMSREYAQAPILNYHCMILGQQKEYENSY